MSHCYESPAMPRSVECSIVAAAKFEVRSGLSLWGTDQAAMSGASTAQLQLLRAAAKRLRRQPWRDNQMRADELLSMTYVALYERGAITDRSA